MQTYLVGRKSMGVQVSDGLADLARRLSERASGGILAAMQQPMQDIVDLEKATAPVRTGRYKASIRLARTISESGVGLTIGAVAYARYIWCPPQAGPVPPGVDAVGRSRAKPGTRWQSYLRRPALAQLDELIKGPLGKAVIEVARGG